jgi:hypothetical protein
MAAHVGRVVAAPEDGGPRFANERTERWQVGVTVQAGAGRVTGILATLPIPMDWPEQTVRVVGEDISPQVSNVDFRVLQDGVRQMQVGIARLNPGERAQALLTLEIVKRDIAAPPSTDSLQVPARVDRDMRVYLRPSPYIESTDRRIRQLAEEITADRETAWSKVEAIYDWVRENVRYEFDVKIRGARQALDDGYGDCEELTSLFVAMCRAVGIPARAVWIPGHCYPEFYLEDQQGDGYWFPCQAAGTRSFGSMPEARPVLQKGDSFKIPGSRKPVRYVAEKLVAKHADANPQVQFVRQQLEAEQRQPGSDRDSE